MDIESWALIISIIAFIISLLSFYFGILYKQYSYQPAIYISETIGFCKVLIRSDDSIPYHISDCYFKNKELKAWLGSYITWTSSKTDTTPPKGEGWSVNFNNLDQKIISPLIIEIETFIRKNIN